MQNRCQGVPGALVLENTSTLTFLMTIAHFWLYIEKRPNVKYSRLLIGAFVNHLGRQLCKQFLKVDQTWSEKTEKSQLNSITMEE